MVVSDNGTELTCNAMLKSQQDRGVEWHYIAPGKPMPALDDITLGYYGTSVGHWEGDTLVVTTKGVKEDVLFFEIPHSDEMTITERIRLTAPDSLENQITIEDPKRLAEPYRFTYGYRRNDEYEMMEYFCDREDPLFKVTDDGTLKMKTGDEVL